MCILKNLLQAYLGDIVSLDIGDIGDIVSLVPDHCNKTNIAVNRVIVVFAVEGLAFNM